ncbi:MAG TPA: hypothetical protein VLZ83_15165 [Edaphocola sp.]|nr:hypothetical protein [Edaphocola sp.]
METVILSSVFRAGEAIGEYAAYALTILGIILLVWVMYRYLDTSDLK